MAIWALLLLVAFEFAAISFMRAQHALELGQHARQSTTAIGTALDQSVTDIETMLQTTAQSEGGNITTLPNNITTTFNLCPVVDASNSASTECSYTIQRTITWAGLANVGASPNETIANVNTQAVGSANVQRDVTVQVSLTLFAANGTTQDGYRVATGHFTVIASCATASTCEPGQQVINTQVTFNGWKDTTGSHTTAAEPLALGKCTAGSDGCSSVGLDNGGTSAQAPGDSRVASQTLCYDPQYEGNGGPNPGDRCNQYGNTPAPAQATSTYANQTLQNSAASSGALAK